MNRWSVATAVFVALLACTGAPSSETPAPSVPPAPEPSGGEPPVEVPALPAGPTVDLQVLASTSGVGAEKVIDGNKDTSWTPAQDPELEGVLLRFEAPTPIEALQLTGCATAGRATLFVGGQQVSEVSVEAKPTVVKLPSADSVLSIFVRLSGKPGVCLAEITPLQEGKALSLRSPREVKGKIETSSTLQPAAAYQAGYLFDGRTHFGWVEGDKGDGVGQWFEVKLKEPQKIDAVQIWNGYQRSDDHFKKNGRLKQVKITIGSESRVLDVEDRQGDQTLKLGASLEGTNVRLDVLQVWPGSKYKDLVISEVRLVGPNGPFGVASQDLARAEDAVRDSVLGTPLETVVGRAFHSMCEGGGKLKLRADSSIVWYGEQQEDGREVIELLDGAWALEPGEPGWAQIELYVRRQVSETIWQPYAETRKRSSDRISGGQLQIATAAGLGVAKLPEALKALAGETGEAKTGCVGEDYQKLIDEGAILVKGTALTDLLVPFNAR